MTSIGPIHGIFELGLGPEGNHPLALLHVPATEHKPFQLLMTAGMSAQPMKIPDEVEPPIPPDRIELAIGLPPDWKVDDPESEQAWPIWLLAELGRFPTESGGWLGQGHTLPNGDPMKPYASSTQTCCALVAPALTMPREAREIPLPGDAFAVIHGVVPLFEREVELKLEKGVDALLRKLDEHRVSELLDPKRRSVAGTLLEMLDKRRGRQKRR